MAQRSARKIILRATPYQRLIADVRISDVVRRQVTAIYKALDPVQLLHTIRGLQQKLVSLADCLFGDAAALSTASLEQFLSGLRTAWQDGEVRPTSAAQGPDVESPLILRTPQDQRQSNGIVEPSQPSPCWPLGPTRVSDTGHCCPRHDAAGRHPVQGSEPDPICWLCPYPACSDPADCVPRVCMNAEALSCHRL